MVVVVDGVSIELTKEQIALIEKEKAKRSTECKTFERALKNFGFKKLNTKGWEDPSKNCWSNDHHGWFADILDHGKSKVCVLHGNGLDDNSPWGKIFECPGTLADAISKALNTIQ